jgi:hypothetical protein
MKIQSRTEIKIEKHEIRSVRINSGGDPIYCRTCGERTVTLTLDELASFLKVGLPEICRQIDASEIHLADSDRTLGLICGRSLKTEEMPEAPGE